MYTFDSKIRYTECDMEGYLTIESLVDYFQDCSTFQTQLGPATMEYLAKDGIAWVISSWHIVINRLPKLGENVTIGTVPYKLSGFLGLRNFFMDTDSGERVAIANSVWSLINLQKGTPQRVTKEIEDTYPLDKELEMEKAPRKIKIPEDAKVYKAEAKKIGQHHLDTNNHVNNGQYIRIALTACKSAALETGNDDLKALDEAREGMHIRAEYKQQAHLGDMIFPVIYESKDEEGRNVYVISLNDENEKPYSIVELVRK